MGEAVALIEIADSRITLTKRILGSPWFWDDARAVFIIGIIGIICMICMSRAPCPEFAAENFSLGDVTNGNTPV